MTTTDPFAGLRAQLNESTDWPAPYMFKWVAPAELVPHIEALLGGATVSKRSSKNGRYVGVTATLTMPSADAVIALYEQVAKLPGVLSL